MVEWGAMRYGWVRVCATYVGLKGLAICSLAGVFEVTCSYNCCGINFASIHPLILPLFLSQTYSFSSNNSHLYLLFPSLLKHSNLFCIISLIILINPFLSFVSLFLTDGKELSYHFPLPSFTLLLTLTPILYPLTLPPLILLWLMRFFPRINSWGTAHTTPIYEGRCIREWLCLHVRGLEGGRY